MLSWSAETTNRTVDLEAIAFDEVSPGLPGGDELLAFTTATVAREPGLIATARDALVAALGPEAMVDAAGVIGNFEMMNRIADGVGMPVGGGTRSRMEPLITSLGLDRFPHA
jgi:alkylhydroperoxidase family enzyme